MLETACFEVLMPRHLLKCDKKKRAAKKMIHKVCGKAFQKESRLRRHQRKHFPNATVNRDLQDAEPNDNILQSAYDITFTDSVTT